MRSVSIMIVLLASSLVLTACGGGGDSGPSTGDRTILNTSMAAQPADPAPVNQGNAAPLSNAQLLASAYQVMLNDQSLTLKAMPYLNQLPRVVTPATPANACATPTLVVPVELSATPANSLSRITIDTVWLHANGKWWQGAIDASRTVDAPGKKNAFAQGCPDASFTANENADVIVRVVSGNETRYLRAAVQGLRAVE